MTRVTSVGGLAKLKRLTDDFVNCGDGLGSRSFAVKIGV